MYGNYTVQDLIEGAFKLRVALGSSAQYAHALDNFRKEHRGLDPFGGCTWIPSDQGSAQSLDIYSQCI